MIEPPAAAQAGDPLAQPLPTRREELGEWLAGEPLVPPAIGLVAGIWLDSAWHLPFPLAVLLFASCGLTLYVCHRHAGLRHVWIALAALAIGAALHDAAYRRWPANAIARYCAVETPARLTGTVITAPTINPPQTGRVTWLPEQQHTRFVLSAESIEGVSGRIPASGDVAVNIFEPALQVSAGDRVELFGTLYRPRPPDNPGQRDWARVHRRNGILAGMSCESAADVRVLSVGAPRSRWMGQLRRWAKAAILDNTYPGEVPGSRLLETLVLGQRSAVDPTLNQAFVDTGTVHYLSVSGSHIGILAMAVWMVGSLVGASRRQIALAAAALLTTYAVLAEPNPPIVRSAIMGDVLCLAVLLRRPVHTANWLALSAIILLTIAPTQLFDPGFQLSFLTLLGVIYLSPPVHRAGRRVMDVLLRRTDPLLMPEIQHKINPPRGWHAAGVFIANHLGWWLAIGLAAWMVGALVGSYHFGQVACWGWLNTILIMPLVSAVLVIGLVKTALAAICPPAAGLLGWPLAQLTDVLAGTVKMLARMPGATFAPAALPIWFVAFALGGLLLWVLAPWLRIRARHLAIIAMSIVLIGVWELAPRLRSDTLRLTVLSVGDGLCCLIELPNGNSMVYDMGSRPPKDIYRWSLGPLLARERIYGLDRLILSHPDMDHFSSAPDLLDRRRVGAIVTSPHFDLLGGSAAKRLLTELQDRGTSRESACRGSRLTGTGEDVSIDVLWPPPPGELSISRTNECSLVLRIRYAGRQVLLCGDIQDLAQRELIQNGGLRADVLLLPHHGSATATTAAFIKAVGPAYCICSESPRSVARRPPTPGLSGKSYSTARDGGVQITIRPDELAVGTVRSVPGSE